MVIETRLEIKSLIREIPDFPKPGISFKDITPILSYPYLFDNVIRDLATAAYVIGVQAIVAPESRGFIFGAPISFWLEIPFVLARKPGKLPYKTCSADYQLEYGVETLEMHEDAISPGWRVGIVDDLVATGGSVLACKQLIEKLGGTVAWIGSFIELSDLKAREKFGDIPYYSVIKY